MPDSYGKRQRNAKKARKLAEREERRLARKQERADREAGVLPEDAEAGGVEPGEAGDPEAALEAGAGDAADERAEPADNA
jgi:hypothetical protein